MRQGQDFAACSLHSAHPQVLWARWSDAEEAGREENFPEALGREGCVPQTHAHMKLLSTHMLGTVWQTSSTCHTVVQPHTSLSQAFLFSAGPLPSGSLSLLQVPEVPGQRGPCQSPPGGAGGLQRTPGSPRCLPLVWLPS